MPILHGANGSPYVRKVKIICAEKSIAYEQDPVVPLGVSDEYRKKSPLGKIPCWEDGDFVLPDSSCIGQYLERKHPEPSLYPSEPESLGRTLWYEEYGDTKVIEVLTPAFFERIIRKRFLNMEPDEERVARVIAEDVPPVLDYLEGEVTGREYLVDNRFTAADIAIASPFVNFAHAGESVDSGRWPNLAAYVERIQSRPSFKSALAEEQAFFSGGQG